MKKALFVVVAVLFLVLSLGSAFAADKVVLRVGHTIAPDSHYQKGLEHFASLLKEKSGGQIEMQIFHSSQLGSERDVIEGVSMGTIEMTLVSSAPLANFTSSFLVFDLPFIIVNREKAYAWMDGPQGRKILDTLTPKNIIGLGIWENGFRMLTNSQKPVVAPEDMKGLKIRLMENPIHVGTFKTLGAYPTPMPFGELFTALQQKIVDGQENPLVQINAFRLYEVQKFCSMTGHVWDGGLTVANARKWEQIPKELQAVITRNFEAIAIKQRADVLKNNEALVAEMGAKGLVFNKPTSPESFREALVKSGFYTVWKGKYGPEAWGALEKAVGATLG